MMRSLFFTATLWMAVSMSGCTANSPRGATSDGTDADWGVEEASQNTPSLALGRIELLIGSIAERMDQLENRQDWIENTNKKSLNMQALVAEARHYERILNTLTQSLEPNLSQIACLKALDKLRKVTAAADRLLEEENDLGALAKVELELESDLLEAKGCVVGYGEVAYVYFRLDHQGQEVDGRTVPMGLNSGFSKENDQLFAKVLASCSKSGVIHLYGYSCDLGTEQYGQTLAYDRALNLKTYLEGMIKSSCAANSDIRLEAHMGGVIELIDPNGRDEELLEYQRERNRVVALFLFNQ